MLVEQVFHLQEAGIASGYMSGAVSWEEQRATMDAMRARPPRIKVVFVTPEKVAASDSLLRLLDDLNASGNLVILPIHERLASHDRWTRTAA